MNPTGGTSIVDEVGWIDKEVSLPPRWNSGDGAVTFPMLTGKHTSWKATAVMVRWPLDSHSTCYCHTVVWSFSNPDAKAERGVSFMVTLYKR
ncbi:hypothetical protein AVEN_261393-1 [Araneus ventricosus]|uniref:Uncharacterized protein n=1 Tax=Araneus ventricosus TaxID=182803 RepID=A0A4Y2MYP4_ARAVE|nr:hypothetical protein AVEN_261393-1 [Araneus ventricosus]